jgi:hypothetical protein
MARGRNVQDLDTLQMALVGYQIEKQKIDDKIHAIEAQLRGKSGALPATAAAGRKPGVKRVLSAGARRRIAAAQRKRWAAHRKRMAQSSK